MKRILTFVLLAATLVAGTALAADPIIGTWTLNVAKSKFNPGPAPKAMTRTYTEAAGVYTLDQKMTGADGTDSTMQVHYRKNKEDKQAGNAAFDSMTAKRIDANTWDFVAKKDGKVVLNVHRVVAHDGKSMIVHNVAKLPSGAKTDDVLLFDKN